MMRFPPERERGRVREGVGKTLINPSVTRATTSSLTTGVVRAALWGCGLEEEVGGFLISASQPYPSIFQPFLLGLCDKQHREHYGRVQTVSGQNITRPFHAFAKKTQPHFQHANETTALPLLFLFMVVNTHF